MKNGILALILFLMTSCGLKQKEYTYCIDYPLGPYSCLVEGPNEELICDAYNVVTTLSSGGNTNQKCWVDINCSGFSTLLDNDKNPEVKNTNDTYIISGVSLEKPNRKIICTEVK